MISGSVRLGFVRFSLWLFLRLNLALSISSKLDRWVHRKTSIRCFYLDHAVYYRHSSNEYLGLRGAKSSVFAGDGLDILLHPINRSLRGLTDL